MPVFARLPVKQYCVAVARILAACVFLAALNFSAPLSTASAQRAAYVPGELIVGLKDGVSSVDFVFNEPLDFALTPKPLIESLNAYIVEVPVGEEADYRARLLRSDDVLFVDFNYYVTVAEPLPFTPNDTHWAIQYGPRAVRADYAWNITTGSASTIIAVVDTGIDRAHPDFAGRLVPGYDFVQGDSTPQDEHGHGTHVAGIAAASGNNALGVAGIDWKAKIMAVRVLDKTGNGTIADTASGIIWAANHGADVINLSLSGPSFPSPTVLEDATYYAYRKGVVIVAAAGNYGSTPVTYPARYPWVIAVGMTDSSNSRRVESNFGADLDLMAPGYSIYSTKPGGYGYNSGTSMSTAFVSGAAALMVTDDKFDSPIKVYEALTQTALDLGTPGWDNLTGYGLLQVDSALAYNPNSSPPVDPQPDVVYELRDSTECSNIHFDWVEVPRTNENFVGIFGNNKIKTVTLPFVFRFAGNDYQKIVVSDNGFVSFDLTTSIYDAERPNGPLPGIGTPQQLLAPYWDDLNPSAHPEAGIYAMTTGSPPARRYIITWHRMPLQEQQSSYLTFQIVLFEESGEVDFQYLVTQGAGTSGDSASIGLEYGNGLFGVQVGFNQPGVIIKGQALKFYPVEEGLPGSPPPCEKVTVLPPDTPAAEDGSESSERTLESMPFKVHLPPGVPPAGTTLQLRTFTAFNSAYSGMINLGRYAELKPSPAQAGWLEPKPRLCYYYTSADVLNAGGHAENLMLAVFDHSAAGWSPLATFLDKDAGTVCAYVPYYSVYGVFGRELPRKLPVTGAGKAN